METTTKRCATANLVEKVDEEVQRLLWSILDAFLSETMKPDYLQIFKLSIVIRSGEFMQKIQHRQEVPPLDREIGCFQVSKVYEGTVWVHLDSTGQQTMMFPKDW